MNIKSRKRLYTFLSLLCGLWFLVAGCVWVDGICTIIGYPIGILGVHYWRKSKAIDPANKLNKFAFGFLVFGFICSVIAFFSLLIDGQLIS